MPCTLILQNVFQASHQGKLPYKKQGSVMDIGRLKEGNHSEGGRWINRSGGSVAKRLPLLLPTTLTATAEALESCPRGIKYWLFHSAASPFLIKKNKHLSPLCPTSLLLQPFNFPIWANRTHREGLKAHPCYQVQALLSALEERTWCLRKVWVQSEASPFPGILPLWRGAHKNQYEIYGGQKRLWL